MSSFARFYGLTAAISFAACVVVGIGLGWAALLTTLVLSILEISLSFDNAVVNAKVLKKMSPRWQRIFMTVGILIAVIGVRAILPILLVAVLLQTGLGQVLTLALHHPAEYGQALHHIHPEIAAFGGIFLLMLFLDYILAEREVLWLQPIEQRLIRLGRLRGLEVVLSLSALLAATVAASPESPARMLTAGIVGLVLYAALKAFEARFEHNSVATTAAKAGLASFIYLEVLDASFSLDGVLGAFAITSRILVIMVGLGIGALWVRSMTVHMVRADTLMRYRFLEHGAHYAIGVLALLLLASAGFEISEVVTGLTGCLIILAAVFDSWRYNQAH